MEKTKKVAERISLRWFSNMLKCPKIKEGWMTKTLTNERKRYIFHNFSTKNYSKFQTAMASHPSWFGDKIWQHIHCESCRSTAEQCQLQKRKARSPWNCERFRAAIIGGSSGVKAMMTANTLSRVQEKMLLATQNFVIGWLNPAFKSNST